MKKYTLSLAILAFVFGLFNINFANAANCASGDLFNSSTGKRCSPNPIIVVECPKGDLFNTTTGERCNAWQDDSSSNVTQQFQIGSRGESVKAFQQILANAGFLFGKIDGIYGPITDGAAKNYYKKYPISIVPLPPIPVPIPTPIPSPLPAPTPKPTPLPLPIIKTEPQISSLSPSSGAVGAEVTISGTGLSGAAIYFGGYLVPTSSRFSRDNETHTTFIVPSSLSNCSSISKFCTQAVILVQAGKYEVYVSNSNGTSNRMTFEVVDYKLNM
jgi:peptidoglycan hydrolase-like protein with peptidoglycan-binding domain